MNKKQKNAKKLNVYRSIHYWPFQTPRRHDLGYKLAITAAASGPSRCGFFFLPVHVGSDMVLMQDPAVSNDRASVFADIQAINIGPGFKLSPDIEHASSLPSIQTDKRSYLDKNISESNSKQEPIAIIGMAVNMPGASDVGRLWEILANSSSTVEEVRF